MHIRSFYFIRFSQVVIYFVLSSFFTQSTCQNGDSDSDKMPIYFIEAIPEENFSNAGRAGDSSLQKKFLGVFDDDKVPKFKLPFIPNPNATFNRVSQKTFLYDKDPSFMEAINDFKEMLMEKTTTTNELLNTAKIYKDKLNHHLWVQGFIGALLNKNNTKFNIPPIVELLPDLMIPYMAIDKALKQASSLSKNTRQKQTCGVRINGDIGKANGIENKLWYFREDLMVNSHHWYWHIEFPAGTRQLADRQGELFYYMHSSILARYHSERLSNDLDPVKTFEVKPGQVIEEPYYSFLRDSNSGTMWTSRTPFFPLEDIQLSEVQIKLSDMDTYANRLNTAANTGTLITPDGIRDIKNFEGIDHLSRTAEAIVRFSDNWQYYGNWHNLGHLAIGHVLDPQNTLGLNPGVMGETATAMRDVVFYRWHKATTDLYETHKSTLPPYERRGGALELTWPGVSVEKIEVQTLGRRSVPPLNSLYTFWNERTFDLSKGLDFNRNATNRGPVHVCIEHLTHDDFTYRIVVVKSASVGTSLATIRIFMAPRFNQNGFLYTMEQQRTLFFVMDTFNVSLNTGRNIIRRRSKDSSLTLPYTKSYRQLEQDEFNEYPWCGCGWPHHLLLPKGKPSGMTFDLFVMVTNGDEDAVSQDSVPDPIRSCKQGYLFCSTMKGKYPDSKPMGYPFDRKPYTVADFDGRRPVANLEEYVSLIPNMNTARVTITHEASRKERVVT